MNLLIDFDLLTVIIGISILSMICLFLKLKMKKDYTYMVFFCILYIYLLFVLKYTIFPIPIYGGLADVMRKTNFLSGINLFPFNSLDYLMSKQALYNILLSIPFGFGVSYIAKINRKNILTLGIAFGFTIELLQLIISALLGFTYRNIDINDIILNFAGVIIGYLFLMAYSYFFIKIIKKFNIELNDLLKYVYNISTNTINRE